MKQNSTPVPAFTPPPAATAYAAVVADQLSTVKQFVQKQPAFTEPAMRALIYKAYPRGSGPTAKAGNGLIQAGALVRIGRRVLINDSAFLAWVKKEQEAK